ncbi:hypothetical protein EST38_g9994 [Candolleomyces aberdarensis]|uniref:Uncharacterized protein n=1 Tax=Candolleomyces aberdarensis TaxID=2316362 RepID=A0A4Q2D8J3_9AGAR|nr:hypothetical protein EST38_g9994 [Candolleomyces aberdarensis]
MELWFSKAGKLKLSLNLKEFKEREYVPGARRNTPKNHARFEPAYKFILKYSSRWERIHFDKDKFVFKNLLHFGAKYTGRYIESVLPLHEMPKLKSLAVQGRGEFVQFRPRFSGVWDKLRQIELGIFASITVDLRILQEGEFDEDVMLTEAARHDIVLRKVHTALFPGFVYTNAILNTLTLPSLSTFTIIKPSACTGTSDFAEQDTDLAVSDWVNRSQCNLQKLELCCIAINNERAIKLLKSLPSLSKLYLEAVDIDCTFLLSLKDELHLLETLQLKVISSDPKAHAYSKFVEDPHRWWTALDDTLVKMGRSRNLSTRRLMRLENTFLETSPKNDGDIPEPVYTRVYLRGFDRLDFAETYEDTMAEDKPDDVMSMSME